MIDPIKAREAVERLANEERTLNLRKKGTLALHWFAVNAQDNQLKIAPGVLRDRIAPRAEGTQHADTVKDYLSKAFCEHHEAIILRAIAMAKEDSETSV